MEKEKKRKRIVMLVCRSRRNSHGVYRQGVLGRVIRILGHMQKHLSSQRFFHFLSRLLTPLESITYEALGGKGRKATLKPAFVAQGQSVSGMLQSILQE